MKELTTKDSKEHTESLIAFDNKLLEESFELYAAFASLSKDQFKSRDMCNKLLYLEDQGLLFALSKSSLLVATIDFFRKSAQALIDKRAVKADVYSTAGLIATIDFDIELDKFVGLDIGSDLIISTKGGSIIVVDFINIDKGRPAYEEIAFKNSLDVSKALVLYGGSHMLIHAKDKLYLGTVKNSSLDVLADNVNAVGYNKASNTTYYISADHIFEIRIGQSLTNDVLANTRIFHVADLAENTKIDQIVIIDSVLLLFPYNRVGEEMTIDCFICNIPSLDKDEPEITKITDVFTVSFMIGEKIHDPIFDVIHVPERRILILSSSISSTISLVAYDESLDNFRRLEFGDDEAPMVGVDDDYSEGLVRHVLLFRGWLINQSELKGTKTHKSKKDDNGKPLEVPFPPFMGLVDDSGRILYRTFEDYRKQGLNKSVSLLREIKAPNIQNNYKALKVTNNDKSKFDLTKIFTKPAQTTNTNNPTSTHFSNLGNKPDNGEGLTGQDKPVCNPFGKPDQKPDTGFKFGSSTTSTNNMFDFADKSKPNIILRANGTTDNKPTSMFDRAVANKGPTVTGFFGKTDSNQNTNATTGLQPGMGTQSTVNQTTTPGWTGLLSKADPEPVKPSTADFKFGQTDSNSNKRLEGDIPTNPANLLLSHEHTGLLDTSTIRNKSPLCAFDNKPDVKESKPDSIFNPKEAINQSLSSNLLSNIPLLSNIEPRHGTDDSKSGFSASLPLIIQYTKTVVSNTIPDRTPDRNPATNPGDTIDKLSKLIATIKVADLDASVKSLQAVHDYARSMCDIDLKTLPSYEPKSDLWTEIENLNYSLKTISRSLLLVDTESFNSNPLAIDHNLTKILNMAKATVVERLEGLNHMFKRIEHFRAKVAPLKLMTNTNLASNYQKPSQNTYNRLLFKQSLLQDKKKTSIARPMLLNKSSIDHKSVFLNIDDMNEFGSDINCTEVQQLYAVYKDELERILSQLDNLLDEASKLEFTNNSSNDISSYFRIDGRENKYDFTRLSIEQVLTNNQLEKKRKERRMLKERLKNLDKAPVRFDLDLIHCDEILLSNNDTQSHPKVADITKTLNANAMGPGLGLFSKKPEPGNSATIDLPKPDTKPSLFPVAQETGGLLSSIPDPHKLSQFADNKDKKSDITFGSKLTSTLFGPKETKEGVPENKLTDLFTSDKSKLNKGIDQLSSSLKFDATNKLSFGNIRNSPNNKNTLTPVFSVVNNSDKPSEDNVNPDAETNTDNDGGKKANLLFSNFSLADKKPDTTKTPLFNSKPLTNLISQPGSSNQLTFGNFSSPTAKDLKPDDQTNEAANQRIDGTDNPKPTNSVGYKIANLVSPINASKNRHPDSCNFIDAKQVESAETNKQSFLVSALNKVKKEKSEIANSELLNTNEKWNIINDSNFKDTSIVVTSDNKQIARDTDKTETDKNVSKSLFFNDSQKKDKPLDNDGMNKDAWGNETKKPLFFGRNPKPDATVTEPCDSFIKIEDKDEETEKDDNVKKFDTFGSTNNILSNTLFNNNVQPDQKPNDSNTNKNIEIERETSPNPNGQQVNNKTPEINNVLFGNSQSNPSTFNNAFAMNTSWNQQKPVSNAIPDNRIGQQYTFGSTTDNKPPTFGQTSLNQPSFGQSSMNQLMFNKQQAPVNISNFGFKTDNSSNFLKNTSAPQNMFTNQTQQQTPQNTYTPEFQPNQQTGMNQETQGVPSFGNQGHTMFQNTGQPPNNFFGTTPNNNRPSGQTQSSFGMDPSKFMAQKPTMPTSNTQGFQFSNNALYQIRK